MRVDVKLVFRQGGNVLFPMGDKYTNPHFVRQF